MSIGNQLFHICRISANCILACVWQNNLHELWALLNYILPGLLSSTLFDTADVAGADVDRAVVKQARTLLEAVMVRRLKEEVEKSLQPKLEFVLKVPLTAMQRKWYQRTLVKAKGTEQLMSYNQLLSVMIQLQKVANHPKCILFQYNRDKLKAASLSKRAVGSNFIRLKAPTLGDSAKHLVAELQSMSGESLISASGKLSMLDRLLRHSRAEGSRVLVFSQYTLTLDVLQQFLTEAFGAESFLRLDGKTNRIVREMEVRAFNSASAQHWIYLISTRAGGQGINLASANIVVLFDTCWNPQVDLQAQDRAHRIGQQKQVRVYRLISQGTIEERILTRARQKLLLNQLVVKSGGDVHLAEYNRDDQMAIGDLWSILSHGAQQIFDVAAESKTLTATDYDAILNDATAVGSEEEALKLAATVKKHGSHSTHNIAENLSEMAKALAGVSSLKGTIFDDMAAFTQVDGDDDTTEEEPSATHSSAGEQSEVSASPLGKRQSRAPKLFTPGPVHDSTRKRKDIQHDDWCFLCHDGGDLICCHSCTRVYHLKCLGLTKIPKGIWRCPWHSCVECGRGSTAAGGRLFHCMTCPLTFCFDCCPPEYVQPPDERSNALKSCLEHWGTATTSYLFFQCTDCVKNKAKQVRASVI